MKKRDLPIVCFCVIFNRGKVLLLRRSPTDKAFPNTWWLPGGHIEEGETLEQGVLREIREETNLTLLPSHINLIKQDTSLSGKPLFLFVGETSDHFVALNDGEHTEYVWINPLAILQYSRNPILINYIKEALMFQSTQFGLTSLQGHGTNWSEAWLPSESNMPVLRKGFQGNPQASMQSQYSSPIVMRKNCATCNTPGYAGSDCGCGPKNLGSLYLAPHDKPIIYGNPMSDWWSGSSTGMKAGSVIALLAVLGGIGYMVMKRK